MAAKKNTNQTSAAAQADSKCTDKNCPTHGEVKVRGRSLVGTVTSDKMAKSVVISWTRRFFVKKFERFERRKSKINAHNPDCVNAKKGDVVEITETRPLSKTKHFVITKILGEETKKSFIKKQEIEAQEAKEAAKLKEKESRAKSDDE